MELQLAEWHMPSSGAAQVGEGRLKASLDYMANVRITRGFQMRAV